MSQPGQYMQPISYGPRPQSVTCNSCHSQVISRVQTEASTKTHIIALLLCGLCCCCLPYMIDSCKNTNHYCPHCNSYMGQYNN